jgi:hypothetical protein
MSTSQFPISVSDFVNSLQALLYHQNDPEAAKLLAVASTTIEYEDYDNWDGGTHSWSLRLFFSIEVFAGIESKVVTLEKRILEKAQSLLRGYTSHFLGRVILAPQLIAAFGVRARVPSDQEVKHIWGDAFFRMFLSHVTAHKKQVGELKRALGQIGVAAFVAHEDIEPSLEWQREIELALGSMHALAALLTTDFHQSSWTDQEVGWAMGRGVPVIPVRLGVNPYGLMGKIQANEGNLNFSSLTAQGIVEVLLKNEVTHTRMRAALVEAFGRASSWETRKAMLQLVEQVTDFTEEEKNSLRHTVVSNHKVMDTWGVPEAIIRHVGPPSPVPVDDDSLPF